MQIFVCTYLYVNVNLGLLSRVLAWKALAWRCAWASPLGHRYLSLAAFKGFVAWQTGEVKANSPGDSHRQSKSRPGSERQQSGPWPEPESTMKAIVLNLAEVIQPTSKSGAWSWP